jgi:hypothetical protein
VIYLQKNLIFGAVKQLRLPDMMENRASVCWQIGAINDSA